MHHAEAKGGKVAPENQGMMMEQIAAGPWAYLSGSQDAAERVSAALLQLMKDGALTETARGYFGIDVSRTMDDPDMLEHY